MKRRIFALPATLLVLSLALGVHAGNPLAGAASVHEAENQACAPPSACGPIQHIIIMDKENRTFDNMFGQFPGANGATTYVGTDGQTHPFVHQPDRLIRDISHQPDAAHMAMDGGKMDKFSQIAGAIQNGVDMADSQFQESDIPNYWSYARHFTLDDAFFSTIMGPSFPNHLFSIAGEDANVDTNPGSGRWGCDSDPHLTVEQRLPDGTKNHVYPCFDFQTLGDLLNAKSIPWKYYAPNQDQSGYVWSAFDAIKHIRMGPDWQTHVVNYTNFAADAKAGTLPAVSWLVQPGEVSDHPPASECNSENFTVQQINAVMSNPTLWAHTAIILTWDDFGGFYDHVVPPAGPNPQISYGFRAPTIIISPYAKSGFIDHTTYSYPSMLKFAEDTFGLPSLTDLDKQSNDMMNSFNFSQTPLPPLPLQTRTCASAPSVADKIPQATLTSVGVDSTGQTTLQVALANAGTGTFVLTKKTRILAKGNLPITLGDISPGDHLNATGTPQPQNAGVYELKDLHDIDIMARQISGAVKSVDAANGKIVLTSATGDVTVALGTTAKLTGPDGAALSLTDIQPTAELTVTGLFNTRTSTLVRAATVHETALPIPLTVSLAQSAVQVGATNTVTVQTAPNAGVSVTVRFPGGDPVTLPAITADATGLATVTLQVPVDAYMQNSTTTATVASTVGGATRTADATFTLTLPKLALLVDKAKIHTGNHQTLTIIASPGTKIATSILFPNGIAWNRTGKTGEHGTLVYKFKVPTNHTTTNSRKVTVTVTRGHTSTHKSFSITG